MFRGADKGEEKGEEEREIGATENREAHPVDRGARKTVNIGDKLTLGREGGDDAARRAVVG